VGFTGIIYEMDAQCYFAIPRLSATLKSFRSKFSLDLAVLPLPTLAYLLLLSLRVTDASPPSLSLPATRSPGREHDAGSCHPRAAPPRRATHPCTHAPRLSPHNSLPAPAANRQATPAPGEAAPWWRAVELTESTVKHRGSSRTAGSSGVRRRRNSSRSSSIRTAECGGG
jgi:hypothetical protein